MALNLEPETIKRWLTGDLTAAILRAHHDAIEETNAKRLRASAGLALAAGLGLLLSSVGETFLSSQMGVHFAFVLVMLVQFSFAPTARDE